MLQFYILKKIKIQTSTKLKRKLRRIILNGYYLEKSYEVGHEGFIFI